MEPWAAVLTVGVVATLIGFIMLQLGKRKMMPKSYAPERTAEALRRDRDMLKGRTS
jgi:hypothetical protein